MPVAELIALLYRYGTGNGLAVSPFEYAWPPYLSSRVFRQMGAHERVEGVLHTFLCSTQSAGWHCLLQ